MLNIGSIQLESNVILAPMSGVTDLPFRKLVKSFGAGLVISEMVASRAMIIETRQSMQKCAIDRSDPTNSCVQLAGCDPEVMSEAAKMNEDMGARIIDLNFGCPAKKVVGGYAGSALMRDEVLASKILNAVVKSVNIPVTMKMRLGWDDCTKNAPSLAKIAEEAGIKMLTVHGRTRCQFYSGKADWKFIARVKDVVQIPVIANGDIISGEVAKECLQKSRADGVMVGRGAYGKPWILNNIAQYLKTGEISELPSLKTQMNIILNHYTDMLNHYGENNGIKISRKHIAWYSAGLPNSSEFRANINRVINSNEVYELIQRYYEELIDQDFNGQ